jgi:hypothetical protein
MTPARAALARRIGVVALIATLAGSNGLLFTRERSAEEERAEVHASLEAAHQAAEKGIAEVNGKLAQTKQELERAQQGLVAAREDSGKTEEKLTSERDDARKKAAALADKLGETEAERDRLKQHAGELDELMKRLQEKKVNVRRLAGIDLPPREEAQVLSVDRDRIPPVLVLRADTLDGLEEGDRLYLVRSPDGKPAITGHAIIERIDRARGLLSARIGKLESGEKVAVGDKFMTYAP